MVPAERTQSEKDWGTVGIIAFIFLVAGLSFGAKPPLGATLGAPLGLYLRARVGGVSSTPVIASSMAAEFLFIAVLFFAVAPVEAFNGVVLGGWIGQAMIAGFLVGWPLCRVAKGYGWRTAAYLSGACALALWAGLLIVVA